MKFKSLSAAPPVAEILAAARAVDPTSPPVRAKPTPAPAPPLLPEPAPTIQEPSVGLNMRVRMSTSDAIALRARERGVSMKTIVMEALRDAGVDVTQVDLEDRTPARRKGM